MEAPTRPSRVSRWNVDVRVATSHTGRAPRGSRWRCVLQPNPRRALLGVFHRAHAQGRCPAPATASVICLLVEKLCDAPISLQSAAASHPSGRRRRCFFGRPWNGRRSHRISSSSNLHRLNTISVCAQPLEMARLVHAHVQYHACPTCARKRQNPRRKSVPRVLR
jgi:hypothetical protein